MRCQTMARISSHACTAHTCLALRLKETAFNGRTCLDNTLAVTGLFCIMSCGIDRPLLPRFTYLNKQGWLRAPRAMQWVVDAKYLLNTVVGTVLVETVYFREEKILCCGANGG